jgi:hypothetical protein
MYMVREPANAGVDLNHHGRLSAFASTWMKYPQSSPLTESVLYWGTTSTVPIKKDL